MGKLFFSFLWFWKWWWHAETIYYIYIYIYIAVKLNVPMFFVFEKQSCLLYRETLTDKNIDMKFSTQHVSNQTLNSVWTLKERPNVGNVS